MARGGGLAPGLDLDLAYEAGPLPIRARLRLQAERAALWGPSAAGKSTLLRLIAGLDRPSAGFLRLDGRTLVDAGVFVPPGERGIGLLAQTPALFPHLSVEANLRFGLRGLARDEQDARTSELLALLDLEALRARRPEKLSGGERQRTALARALAPRPRLLLLDEPFSALDLPRKHALWAALDSYLSRHGIAALLVSHDPAEVLRWAACVARMEAGVITGVGAPGEVLAGELVFLEELLGRSRMPRPGTR